MTGEGLSASTWRRLCDAHPAVMLLVEPTDGRVVAANRAAERFYGHRHATLCALGLTELSVAAATEVLEGLRSAVAEQGTTAVVAHRRANGQVHDVEVAAAPLELDGHTLLACVVHDRGAVARDGAAPAADVLDGGHQRAERLQAQLAASHRRFEALVEHASEPILVLTPEGEITYASPAAAAFLGGTELSPAQLRARIPDADRSQLRSAWRAILEGADHPQHVVLRVRRADGRSRHLAVTLSDLRDSVPVGGIVLTARDLTDELAVRSRLEHQTTHDGLTGLANRDLLLDELRRFAHGHATAPRRGALILLDLVGMSGINDRTGHRTGDYLLRSVAHRLVEAAGSGATVARTSGDEFGVLVPGPRDEAAALRTARAYATLFDEPFTTPGGGSVLLRARFGVALAGGPDSSAAGILRDANLALSAADAPATGRIRVCDDRLRRAEERRLALEFELATPGITEQLDLLYQPIVDLARDRITTLEVLLRWDHPGLGRIDPSEFVPLAERNGAIVPIGTWVLRRACQQLAAWDASGLTPPLTIAVNLSARQLLDVDLVPALATALTDSGLEPDRVCLEVTETAIADNSAVTTATVEALAELGVGIHIDDFGTGYSSFAQLRRFPFHGLKIDRSFIEPLGTQAEAEPIVAALLAIAQAQGLDVVAEGVETDLQLAHLQRLGCPQAQGYLWAHPLTAAEVPAVRRTEVPRRGAPRAAHRPA